jgi:hypothetical protein
MKQVLAAATAGRPGLNSGARGAALSLAQFGPLISGVFRNGGHIHGHKKII